MTADLPQTRRAALQDLAGRIYAGKVLGSPSVEILRLAEIVEREAERYPEAEPARDWFVQPTQPDPTDYAFRWEALHCAAIVHAEQGPATTPAAVLADAREFEAYLRGGAE